MTEKNQLSVNEAELIEEEDQFLNCNKQMDSVQADNVRRFYK